ncbi:MAG: hypothetical protein FRX49_08786 [Trebouxia sp. A1-2]|nr:MAG: hypothetical protein FRX49_08786 [Trebouxia sp. A1-2]
MHTPREQQQHPQTPPDKCSAAPGGRTLAASHPQAEETRAIGYESANPWCLVVLVLPEPQTSL